MALFGLHSEITIDDFTFRGVHEVRIEKGIRSYTERAFIQLPSLCRIVKGKRATQAVYTTGSLFTDGAPVSIKLGYNGELQTEFEGFVKRRNIGMPIEVECEGYVRQLREVAHTKHYASTTLKAIMKDVLKGTDIELVCPVDFPLKGITLTNANGCAVIDHLKKISGRALTFYFIEPKKLWCGLVYTPYIAGTKVFNLPLVHYRLGYNCIKDNQLKERVPDEPVQVIINGQLATGDTVRTESKDKYAKRKVTYLNNNIPDKPTLQSFAQERADQMNYTGYEGSLTGFLQPYCLPGYTAQITDDRYPERDGSYLVAHVQVSFGMGGARRTVGLGIKTS